MKSVGIIKASENFKGNLLERNVQRIEKIKMEKEDIYLELKIEKLLESIKEYNLYNVQYMIERELFYEIVSIDVINRYVNKLNQFDNIDDFKYAYRLKAEIGFRRTMDYLIRRKDLNKNN